MVTSSSSSEETDDDEDEDYLDENSKSNEEFLVQVPDYMKIPPASHDAQEKLSYILNDNNKHLQSNSYHRYSLSDETNQDLDRPKSAVKSTRPKSARPNSVRTSNSASYGTVTEKPGIWLGTRRASTGTADDYDNNSDSDF